MKNRTLIAVAVIMIALTLVGNRATLYFSLQDTAGVEKDMTFAEYTALFPEDKRMDFWNYSLYANNREFPVLIRFEEDKIVEIQVVDMSKAKATQENFEKITEGMTLSMVTQMVGAPGGVTKTDNMTLAYNIRNKVMYLIQFVEKDGVLYVQSVTSESLE